MRKSNLPPKTKVYTFVSKKRLSTQEVIDKLPPKIKKMALGGDAIHSIDFVQRGDEFVVSVVYNHFTSRHYKFSLMEHVEDDLIQAINEHGDVEKYIKYLIRKDISE